MKNKGKLRWLLIACLIGMMASLMVGCGSSDALSNLLSRGNDSSESRSHRDRDRDDDDDDDDDDRSSRRHDDDDDDDDDDRDRDRDRDDDDDDDRDNDRDRDDDDDDDQDSHTAEVEIYTLHKCDETGEKLVDVNVADPWSYDEYYSSSGVYMYLNYENDEDNYIYICNEAEYEPLYSYLCNYAINTEISDDVYDQMADIGMSNYECNIDVIGTAFDRRDCLLVTEEYDDEDDGHKKATYLAFQYSDGGFAEFLIVNFNFLNTRGWTDDDYLDLAKTLFGN